MTTQLAETLELVKGFDDRLAVDRVSISVHAGEVVGLVGANGAGKTTLIRMLLGLLAPDEGHVRLHGEPPGRSARHRIGYMPQGLGLYRDLTVGENLAFIARVYGTDPPPLGPLASIEGTVVGDLPLGSRRRVAFVAALCHSPDLLILDEPTSGVGPLGRSALWETIHESADRGAGVLVSTHHMDEAEQCDRLVFLSAGRQIFTGTAGQVLEGQETVQIRARDPGTALAALEQAGLPVLPAGDGLRVPGASVDAVRAVLGDRASLRTSPSTLEEAFVTLVTA
jgi:ABC-2 type transport system ATP-binding protein/ribosome-dependent ATPase